MRDRELVWGGGGQRQREKKKGGREIYMTVVSLTFNAVNSLDFEAIINSHSRLVASVKLDNQQYKISSPSYLSTLK